MSDEAIPTAVPRPARCCTRIKESSSELELHFRKSSAAQLRATALIAIWLTGWTVGTWELLTLAAADLSLRFILMFVVFAISWLVGCGLFVRQMVGCQSLRINAQGASYEFRAVTLLASRQIPLQELKRAMVAISSPDSESGRTSEWLQIETTGRPLKLGCDLETEELRWLAQRINQQFDALCPQRDLSDAPTTVSDSPEAEPQRNATSAEILVRVPRPRTPPSDCRFVMRDDLDSLHFISAGRWNLATIAGATVCCTLRNGHVGIFVLELIRKFEWFLFLFLIPFEVIGLLIFCGWILALGAPAYCERWTFGPNKISRRRSFLGFGWTRRYPIDMLDRIELHDCSAPVGAMKRPGLVDLAPNSRGDFHLSLISGDQKVALLIQELTEGEARWMADQVLRARPKWFWGAHAP